jgi:hypothetical protein
LPGYYFYLLKAREKDKITDMITHESNFYNKVAILIIATIANIFIVWFFIIRPDSSNLVGAQIAHLTSPYEVNEANDGLIVDNQLLGYEFKLPPGFTTTGARNFSFSLKDNGREECLIKHYYFDANKAKNLSSDDKKAVVILKNLKLIFELADAKAAKTVCGQYLKQVSLSVKAN